MPAPTYDPFAPEKPGGTRMVRTVDIRGVPDEIRETLLDTVKQPQIWRRWSIIEAYKNANVGTRFAARRILLQRITQAELAKLAGVRQSDVSNAEENYGKVRADKLEKIAVALGTTFKDLINGSDIQDLASAEEIGVAGGDICIADTNDKGGGEATLK